MPSSSSPVTPLNSASLLKTTALWLANPFKITVEGIAQTMLPYYQQLSALLPHTLEEPFFIKAQQESGFLTYQMACADLRQRERTLLSRLSKNKLGPNALRTALLAPFNKEFNTTLISPLEYQRHLVKLEHTLTHILKLPVVYSQVVQEARARFQERMQTHPKATLNYFYQDVINHLIDVSGRQLSAEDFLKRVSYYQDLIAEKTYHAVFLLLEQFIHTHKEELARKDDIYLEHAIPNQHYEVLIAAINSIYVTSLENLSQGNLNATELTSASTQEINNLQTLSKTSPHPVGLPDFYSSLQEGWKYVKSHANKAGVLGIASLVIADQYQQYGLTSKITSNFETYLPYRALSYLGINYGLSTHSKMSHSSMPLSIVLNTLPWFMTVNAQTTGSAGFEDQFLQSIGGLGTTYGDYGQQTNDGGYIVIGSTTSYGAGSDDVFLAKFTANGTLSWAKTLGGTAEDVGSAVQQTTDNGYITVGYTLSHGAGDIDVLLAKWTSNGTLTWAKTMGGIGDEYGYKVQQTTDSGYIVVGYTDSFGAGSYDALLSKWAEDGTLTWAKTLGGIYYDIPLDGQQTSDNGYIITGYTSSYGAGNYDMFLAKWTVNGILSWAKTLGGASSDISRSVQPLTDGSYITLGQTASFGAGGNDVLLSKWTNNGTLTWAKTLGGVNDDLGYSIQQTRDGEYIGTGYTASFGSAGNNVLLAKWSIDGTFVWAKTFGEGVGYSVQQASDGDYILTGDYYPSTMNIFLAKLNSMGDIHNCTIPITIQPSNNPISPSVSTISPTVITPSPTVSIWAVTPVSIFPPQNFLCYGTNNNEITTGFGTSSAITTSLVTTNYNATTQQGTHTAVATTGASSKTATSLLATTQVAFTTQLNQLTSDSSTTGVSASPLHAKSNTGLIIGVVVGAVSLIIVISGVTVFVLKKRQQQNASRSVNETELQTHSDQDKLRASSLLSPERIETHTLIGSKYELITKINKTEAEALLAQEGIIVAFENNKNKAKVTFGQGQFGKLRLARDINSKRFIGVKKIKGNDQIKASEQEAQLQKALIACPHIMPLLASVKSTGSEKQPVLYHFMPLASFGNGDYLKIQLTALNDTALKERILIHLAKAFLLALQMHTKHIFHFDLKPANTVFDQQGIPYLIDFGCAKALPQDQVTHERPDGDTRYFSPERIAYFRACIPFSGNPEQVKTFMAGPSDAWSLGVMLLEFALGKFPFEACTANDKLTSWDTVYFKQQLERILELQQPTKESLWAVIKGLLDVDPKTRLTPEAALGMPVFQNKSALFTSEESATVFSKLKAIKTNLPLPQPSLNKDELTKIDENYAYSRKDYLPPPNPAKVLSNAPNTTFFRLQPPIEKEGNSSSVKESKKEVPSSGLYLA